MTHQSLFSPHRTRGEGKVKKGPAETIRQSFLFSAACAQKLGGGAEGGGGE